MKYLTKDETQRLIVHIEGKRDNLLIQMGLILGCRVSEICSIEIKNIRSDCIKIWDEKKDRYREVVIDPKTKAMLEDYLATEWKPEPYEHHKLFYFSTKTANRIFKHYCELAEIPDDKRHWHTVRHTYVQMAIDQGVPLPDICEQTGDSPTTVIRIYGAPSIDNRLKHVAEKGRFWE